MIFYQQVLEDMKHFSDLMKSDQERLGLSTEQALLVGRDGVMKNLQELIDTDNKREKRTHCKSTLWTPEEKYYEQYIDDN